MGYWIWDIGYWVLAIGDWLLNIGGKAAIRASTLYTLRFTSTPYTLHQKASAPASNLSPYRLIYLPKAVF